MVIEIITALVAAAGLLLIAFFLLKKPVEAYVKHLTETSSRVAEERSRQVFAEERTRLDERFKDKEQVLEEKIRSGDRSGRENRDVIRSMVEKISSELARSQQKIEATEKERIGEFKTLATVVQEYKTITAGIKQSADDLKNILSNNQLRGKYGEEVAENLLKAVGFVKGQNYVLNMALETGPTRPDVTIFLPDKTKINIDVKFPLQSLLKSQETNDKAEQERYLRQFATDVRDKIKQVSTRDYISPEEKTVDFVVLFVPNEMIFSYIYDHLSEVWDDALHKKVILAGPFSFTAILRMIYQSYKNFTYQENIYDIIKLVKTFEQEWEKFGSALDTLGDRLESAGKQYQQVSTTRAKKLNSVIDKIKGEQALLSPPDKQIDSGESTSPARHDGDRPLLS